MIHRKTMRVYPQVSGLAAWSENCKWYSSLPLVQFATITLCVASQQVFIVVGDFIMTQSGNFWIHPHTVMMMRGRRIIPSQILCESQKFLVLSTTVV
jgi:hypothetical protein